MIRLLTTALLSALLIAAPAQAITPAVQHAHSHANPTAPTTPAKPFLYAPKTGDVMIGKETAPVVVVEYASLSCPHCKHFYIQTLPELTKKYIDTGKARFVYRHFPLNAPALAGAKLVQCAADDRKEPYLNVLFTLQDKWVFDVNYNDALADIALLGGMSRDKFDACMKDKTIEKAIVDGAKQAQDDYKVASTPSFFIDGKLQAGDNSIATLSTLIDAAVDARAKKK